ncbi:MAG: hypothetical protein Q7T01_02530 [bacterium]|nr:hypothetical protein [bacterium]
MQRASTKRILVGSLNPQKIAAVREKAKPSKLLDVLQGDKWYQLTPTRIECIDEEYCGFKKRALDLMSA